MVNTFTNLLPNQWIGCLEIRYVALGTGVLPRLFSNDLGLTLAYFMARSNMVVVVVSPLAELSLVYFELSGILVVVKTLRYICWACVSESVVEK